MIGASVLKLRNRANSLAYRVSEIEGIAEVQVKDDTAYLGGGLIPEQGLSSVVIRIRFKSLSETEISKRLRLGTPSVISRVQGHHVVIDVRTVFESQEDGLVSAIALACRA